MKLQLYKVNNRYTFVVGKFSSLRHFLLCADIKPSYKYAWEAYRDAHKLYHTQYSHIEALQKFAVDDLKVDDLSAETVEQSAEKMILDHYSKILEIMVNRTKSFRDEEDKELVYGEIKAIVSGILKVKENLENEDDKEKVNSVLSEFRSIVQEKFSKLLAKDKEKMEKEKSEDPPSIPQLSEEIVPTDEPSPEQLPITPMAKAQIDKIIQYGSTNIDDIRNEVLEEYAERVCKSIEKRHPDAICKIDYESGTFRVSVNDNSILRISVNDDLIVEDIEPEGELSKAFPLHSLEFYQKYWKPIVEKLGHCLSRDLGMIICPAKSSLPDIPNSFPVSVKVMGLDVEDKNEKPFELSFSGEKPTWMLKKAKFAKEAIRQIKPSRYTEEDFIMGQPQRVICIDPNQPTLNGQIGEVKQVLPLEDHIEVDVDFGGVIVRLTEDQFRKVDEITKSDEISPNT